MENTFIHIATAQNIDGKSTIIDHPGTNGNPDAILIITSNYGQFNTYQTRAVGVGYSNSKWVIFNQDGSPMTANATFNVFVAPKGENALTVAASSISAYKHVCKLDHPKLNNNPDAKFLVTPNPGSDGLTNNNAIGLWYYSDQNCWTVFNQNCAPLPGNLRFNVLIDSRIFTVEAPSGLQGNYFGIESPMTNGASGKLVFTNQVYYYRDVYNPTEIGVWYSPDKWTIFNQDKTPMPAQARFFAMGVDPVAMYNTSDPAVKSMLQDKIRKIMLNNPVKTDGATQTNPVVVKVGFVFCQFKDVKADSTDSIDADYKKLIGFKTDTSNELTDFISTQSNGTVRLVLERHVDTNGNPAWVDLSKNYNEYKWKQGDLVSELDNLHDFKNDWQIAIIAFPNNYTEDVGAYFTETVGSTLAGSFCSNGCKVDGVQNVNLIFLDPSVYKEKRPEYTTIHEVCHALGLPDMYNAGVNRSFGWSLMSDCRQGWQLTGFEKLALGWDSLDNYIFLKSGTLTTSIKAQSAGSGIKGVIVLPEDNATKRDFYFMEIPQSLGAETSTKTDCSGNGLLMMVAKQSSEQGCISPFVKGRNTDTNLGGASKAPFDQGAKCQTNGITISGIGTYDAINKSLPCTISVDGSYTSPSSAAKLRENEQLVSGSSKFRVEMTGNLVFDGYPYLYYNGARLDLSTNLMNQDYGFCAYVDNTGVFTLAAATEANQLNPVVVKKFSQVVPAGLTSGDYFFKLEVIDNKPQIAVYQGKPGDPSPVFKYILFRSAAVVAATT